MSNVLHTISVAIAASVTGKAVFGAVAADLALINVNAKQAQSALMGINKGAMLAMGGMVAMGAGIGILKGLKAPLDAAEKWQQTVAKLQILGMGDQVNSDAIKFAKGMDIVGSSYTDNLRMMTEAVGVFRDAGGANPLGDAKMVSPIMAKLAMIDSSLDDTTKASYHHQELGMLRFAEMSGGLQSSQRMSELLEAGYKAIRSSGGNVSWEDLRQFKARAGAAGFNLSDTALFGELEPIMGELKGSSAGVGLRTAFVRAIGALSLTPVNATLQYEKMGLWDKSKVARGGFLGMHTTGNPLIDPDKFTIDPAQWYEQHVHGYYEQNKTTQADRIRDNQLLFGSTGALFFNLVEKQWPKMQQSVMAQAKMLGINGSYDVAKNTIIGLKQQAATNFENLMITMGTQLIPMVTAGLKILNPVLKGIADFAEKHPTITRVAVVLTALGGVLLTVGGAIATVVGVGMLLAPALGAIGTAIGSAAAAAAPVVAIVGGVAIALGVLAFGIKKFIDFVNGRNAALHPATPPPGPAKPGTPAHIATAAAAAHKQGLFGALADNVISYWDASSAEMWLGGAKIGRDISGAFHAAHQQVDKMGIPGMISGAQKWEDDHNPINLIAKALVAEIPKISSWLSKILQQDTQANLRAESLAKAQLAALNKPNPAPVVTVMIDGKELLAKINVKNGPATGLGAPSGFTGARNFQPPGATPKR